ncbi:ABC-type sugar transport system ATPase subunit [Planctomycetales bacterium 10988]|nr:ABC-type sugar transport system ATPase subunit [Planctomycetales bacterium 10988]
MNAPCSAPSTGEHSPLLHLEAISKAYAAPVLKAIDFGLQAGEIHALLGANGAGKSTLCRIISGLTAADSGKMWLASQPYRPREKSQAEAAGVQIVQQELNLLPTLTVAENLYLNRLPHRWGWIQQGRLHHLAHDALMQLGLDDIAPDTLVGSLGVGQQQLVEIAGALSQNCRVLILDEPTAALTHREIEQLFQQLRRLRAAGVGMIYISHRLEEIKELADRATVLRDGKLIETRAVSDFTTQAMVESMTGESTKELQAHTSYRTDRVLLQVEDLSRSEVFAPISFEVYQGERLGISGLVGSGRTELLRAIFGADQAESGEIKIGGKSKKRFLHPQEAVAAGLALVTENRKEDGLLLSQSIRTNTTLSDLPSFRRRLGRLDQTQEFEQTAGIVDRLDTRCQSLDQPTQELSGGNQQKVVVGRWLLRDAEIFLLDEPTRGIDVAARSRLHRLMAELAERGKALVIVSSDLEELLETCDRILVLSAGRLTGEFFRESWTREAIMEAAFRGYRQATASESA